MEKNNFWNEAAKYGAVIGALLSVSFLVENTLTLSGKLPYYMFLVVEFIAVVVVHYYLLHRYTRRRSAAFDAETGFSFGQGYSYILLLSGFAGVILGLVQTFYLHAVLGYSNYVDKYLAALGEVMSRGAIPASAESSFAMLVAQMRNAPEPSVFSTFGNGILVSLLFGVVFGLIIAGVLARAPRPFGNESNQ